MKRQVIDIDEDASIWVQARDLVPGDIILFPFHPIPGVREQRCEVQRVLLGVGPNWKAKIWIAYEWDTDGRINIQRTDTYYTWLNTWVLVER